MADKKSIFEKYKSIDENGEINKESIQTTQETEVTETIPQADEDKTVLIEKDSFVVDETEQTTVVLAAEETSEEMEIVANPVVSDSSADDEDIDEIMKSISKMRIEEIPVIESPAEPVAEISKEEKPVKEKKAKAPKEKKVKEPKEKKAKTPKIQKEKEDRGEPEPATRKDYFTIALALVAVVAAIAFVLFKYFPSDTKPTTEEATTASEQELASIQVFREGYLRNLVQTDIPDVFYQFSSDYSIQYYQYRDNRMVPVQTTGTVSTTVDYGKASLPVKIEYVKVGDKVFGIGLYRADQNPNIPLFNIQLIMFKMTNLPTGYDTEGKALLVSKITGSPLLESEYNDWAESFVLDLNSGKTSRFLKVINRNTDPATGLPAEDFCVLTTQGYNSTTGKIPFFTARDYGAGVVKEDIFIKSGSSESMLIRDVARRLVIVDGNAVVFMRYSDTGFNILRKENGTEKLVFKFTVGTSRCLFDGDYILDRETATLYNMRTGEEKLVVGFKMTSPEAMKISPDGKYLIVMGTMNNVMDYQVHVFNLETGQYAKYIEKNYSTIPGHTKNLSFIDNHTVMYMLIDPNRGRECVVLDLAKAFE